MKVIITKNESNELIMRAGSDEEITFLKKVANKFNRNEKILHEFEVTQCFIHINETK